MLCVRRNHLTHTNARIKKLVVEIKLNFKEHNVRHTQTAEFVEDAFYVPLDFHPRAFLSGRPTMKKLSVSVLNSHVQCLAVAANCQHQKTLITAKNLMRP